MYPPGFPEFNKLLYEIETLTHEDFKPKWAQDHLLDVCRKLTGFFNESDTRFYPTPLALSQRDLLRKLGFPHRGASKLGQKPQSAKPKARKIPKPESIPYSVNPAKIAKNPYEVLTSGEA